MQTTEILVKRRVRAVRCLALTGVLCAGPVPLVSQPSLPSIDSVLASAAAPTWLAALAAACESLSPDSTWPRIAVP